MAFFLSLTSSSSESSSVLEQASSLMGFVGYGYPGNGGSGSELWVPICIHIPSFPWGAKEPRVPNLQPSRPSKLIYVEKDEPVEQLAGSQHSQTGWLKHPKRITLDSTNNAGKNLGCN